MQSTKRIVLEEEKFLFRLIAGLIGIEPAQTKHVKEISHQVKRKSDFEKKKKRKSDLDHVDCTRDQYRKKEKTVSSPNK